MPDYRQQQKDYARYRMERAFEDLQSAQELFADGHFRAANNRAYYAIFHSMRAALALKSVDSSKHSGVIAEFRRLFIKEGLIPVEVSQMIGSAFTIRNASDYDDMFVASKTETKEQIENAKYVYKKIFELIDNHLE
ncbi:MAG: HEPN domain-containing protein [Anaerovoracaceae bacterium]